MQGISIFHGPLILSIGAGNPSLNPGFYFYFLNLNIEEKIRVSYHNLFNTKLYTDSLIIFTCCMYILNRFAEVAELVMVCWLEIQGTINTKMLSPNTTYGAYLIVKFPDRAFGLETLPSEVSVEVGDHRSRGTVYLRCNAGIRTKLGRVSVDTLRSRDVGGGVERVIEKREDGWLEIELGDFYNDGSEREVKMSLREVKGQHLKGGIVVEGIELRPKL